ncbi:MULTISPECIES: c-type cytochrome [Tistrella]|jgi:mono/diheme cytochrome c family protein|uniref:c-type cytochrome n=1 Tax=Alphaproteobacteria TaxID=28211 RepID=UPI000C891CAB|nr:cytochrome c [Tistrella sp.]MAD35436.1 cytochrome C [Tistrella sp.]MCB1414771.1 cytochrome c [Xanthobacteraceae bacterium]
MRRNAIFLSAIAVSALAAIAAFAQAQGGNVRAEDVTFLGQPVTRLQIVRGKEIYAQNCASCHGANLEGQPDWKRRLENGRMPAPPHDESGHTWHHSDQDLFAITKLGVGGVVPGYESDMLAFGDILSDEDITAVLAFIKSTWPERQRDVQARITASDGDGS